MKKDSRNPNSACQRREGRRSCAFFEGRQGERTIQHRQSFPITPGKAQEVVGVEVIPAASCPPRSQVLINAVAGKVKSAQIPLSG